MTKYLILILTICICNVVNAQEKTVSPKSSDEKAITKVISQLFDGMRLGDSSMVSACFYSEVEMFTSYSDRQGNPHLKKGDLPEFLKAVGTPHNEIWDEVIWNIKTNVNGNLAQVWMDYAFYVGEKFSHCGVNALHLTKTKEGWKIFHLADTRQQKGCIEPDRK